MRAIAKVISGLSATLVLTACMESEVTTQQVPAEERGASPVIRRAST